MTYKSSYRSHRGKPAPSRRTTRPVARLTTKRSALIKRNMTIKRARRMFGAYGPKLIAICVIIIAVIFVIVLLAKKASSSASPADVANFRIPSASISSLYQLSQKYEIDFSELLTLFALDNNFFPEKSLVETDMERIEKKYILNYNKMKGQLNKKEFVKYHEILRGIVNDIVYFPVAFGFNDFMYGDNFRGTGSDGKRQWGCEIFDRENVPGRLRVCSMTSGVIEKKGYSDNDGYFVSIRATGGNVYYYGRFDSLNASLVEGEALTAGTLLGYMGRGGKDRANAPVGLLIKISPVKGFELGDQGFINPYGFLRLAEEKG